MSVNQGSSAGTSVLWEMMELASFPKGTTRYVSRSLDIGMGRGNAADRWSRNDAETVLIRSQQKAYRRLDEIRFHVRDDGFAIATPPAMAALFEISAFDLAQGELDGFASYRFLYERLIGPRSGPPATLLAAAVLPTILLNAASPWCGGRRRMITTLIGRAGNRPSFPVVDVEHAAIGARAPYRLLLFARPD